LRATLEGEAAKKDTLGLQTAENVILPYGKVGDGHAAVLLEQLSLRLHKAVRRQRSKSHYAAVLIENMAERVGFESSS